MIVFTQSTAALSSETCSGDVHMPCRFPHDMHEPMAPPAQTDTAKIVTFSVASEPHRRVGRSTGAALCPWVEKRLDMSFYSWSTCI